MSQRYVFLGPNGSGKSTQAKAIAAQFGLSYVSAGDLLRREVAEKTPFGIQYAEDMKNGILAPVSVTNDLLKKEIDSFPIDRGYIIDGYPRTIEQLNFLNENFDIDACVYLTIENVAEIVRRSLARGRIDDTEEVIRKRLDIYQEQAGEILSMFEAFGKLITVEASGSIDVVYSLTVSKMGLSAASV